MSSMTDHEGDQMPRKPAPAAEPSPCTAQVCTCTTAVDGQFDRFLELFNEASRNLGNLFPYSHLRRAAAREVGRGAIAITIRAPCDGSRQTACVIRDGVLARVRDPSVPIHAHWEIGRETIEDALARPWAYLAHPEQFAMGWFTASSRGQPTPVASGN